MPMRQKTFGLVPTTLASPAGTKPPMTSKQAKKAYLAARRRPKVSREEQRRLDKEELERQKQEYERERAAAKAKLAREKKAAKAAAERAERKRKGEPEPNRSVRASQPRISLFVQKVNQNKRTWEDLDKVHEESRDVSEERSLSEDHSDTEEKQSIVIDNPPCADGILQETETVIELPEENSREQLSTEPSQSVEQPLDQQQAHPDDDIKKLEDAQQNSEISVCNSPGRVDEHPKQLDSLLSIGEDEGSSLDQTLAEIPIEVVPELKTTDHPVDVNTDTIKISEDTSRHDDSDDEFGPFPTMSQLDILVLQEGKGPGKDGICQKEAAYRRRPTDTCAESTQGYIELRDGATQRRRRKVIERDLEYDSYNFCNESQFSKNPLIQMYIDARDNYEPRRHREPARRYYNDKAAHYIKSRPSVVPQNSQRRVLREMSHNASSTLSLQKRAIYGASIQTNKPQASKTDNEATHLRPLKTPPSATQCFLEQHLDDFFPSPSQEIRELLADVDDLPSNTQIEKELRDPPPEPQKPPDMPLFFTQDIMSSQEELEITTPRGQLRPRPRSTSHLPPVPLFSSQDIMSSQEELEIIGSCHPQPEARTETSPKRPTPMRTSPTPQEPLARPRLPFFQEKEEDLMHAALEESKIMAKSSGKTTHTSGQQERHRKRKRQRASSITTDYGDEELKDCEEELLALLG